MSEEIRLWKIEGDQLSEYHRSDLNLESRLEEWLARDISILAPDLLVIGRQVETAFGGFIDLLCMNESGELMIVELKRRKTPREVTAQALDYASWVANLSGDRITSLADAYLKDRGPLDAAFRRRFHRELPDSLNTSHSMIIVAAEIDPSSERIMNYLSDSYGVGINAATFQYFRSTDNQEFLARTFLIEPSQVEYKTQTKGTSRRLPNLTYEELERTAQVNGVHDLYTALVSQLTPLFQRNTTRSSVSFTANSDGSRKAIFNLIPGKSSQENGLHFQVYLGRMAKVLGVEATNVLNLLPETREEWQYYGTTDQEYSGYAGYFRYPREVDRFVEGIERQLKQRLGNLDGAGGI